MDYSIKSYSLKQGDIVIFMKDKRKLAAYVDSIHPINGKVVVNTKYGEVQLNDIAVIING